MNLDCEVYLGLQANNLTRAGLGGTPRGEFHASEECNYINAPASATRQAHFNDPSFEETAITGIQRLSVVAAR